MPRAAALLPPAPGCSIIKSSNLPVASGPTWFTAEPICGLNRYLPLDKLADDFYSSQHETGYLEAGSLIEFMVNTWGWPAFSDFYRDIHPDPSGSQAKAIDKALQVHFGLGLAELEDRFLEALRTEKLTPELVDDVRLTIDYYDTVRRYQKLLDPSAYFLTAWLPDASTMRRRGIVADYLRRPSEPSNVALETLLVQADSALSSGDYVLSEDLLKAINASLDALPQGSQDHPPSAIITSLIYRTSGQPVHLPGKTASLFFPLLLGIRWVKLDFSREPVIKVGSRFCRLPTSDGKTKLNSMHVGF
jgi:hypothetical protein